MEGQGFWHAVIAVGTAIVTVAIVAVIVSKNSQAPAVIQSGASGFSNALDVAVSPVTGNTSPPNLAYPAQQQQSAFHG